MALERGARFHGLAFQLEGAGHVVAVCHSLGYHPRPILQGGNGGNDGRLGDGVALREVVFDVVHVVDFVAIRVSPS